MNGYDGSVNIGTKIDTGGIKKGSKDVKKGLDGIKGAFKSLVPQVDMSKLAMAGFATAAVAGVKKLIGELNKCAEVYRVQAKAEKALAAAAKNNPYLDKESVANLKAFASELQAVSEIGDEVSIGLMSQLASAGRTEEDIKKIMRTAADMAASGMMSIDSAVKNLNKSFSGLAGELGEVVPELKGLSVEQMQQGAGVDLIAGKVKGIAKETADINVQMANAIGDLKENIGKGWEEALAPMKKAFFKAITEINAKIAQKEEVTKALLTDDGIVGKDIVAFWEKTYGKKAQKEAKKMFSIFSVAFNDAAMKGTNEAFEQVFKNIEENTELSREKLIALNDAYNFLPETAHPYIEKLREEIEHIEKTKKELKEIDKVLEQSGNFEQRAEALKKARKLIQALRDEDLKQLTLGKKTREELLESLAEKEKKLNSDILADKNRIENEKNEKVEKLLKIYNESIAKKEQELALQAQLSREPIDELTYAQEMLNTRTQAYIALMQNGEGLISGNAAREVAEREKIAELIDTVAQKSKEQKDAQDTINEALEITKKKLEEINNETLMPKTDAIQAQIEAVKEAGEKIKQLTDRQIEAMTDGKKTKEQLLKDLADVEIALEKEKVEAVKNASQEKVQATAKEIAERLQIINDFANQANQIASDISAFATSMINTERDLKIAALKEQNLSSEEYAEKEKEIRKEAAKEQYKVDMFKWTSALLSATANIALGITRALSEGGPYAGPILAAMMGVAGGIQMASLIASKPRPPSFAGGGIVGGNSYSGDKVRANVNSGEMILNAAQQRALWETANGRGHKDGTNIVIHNSASNQVRTTAKVDKGQIEIMVNSIVNRRLADGTYDVGMAGMEMRKQGKRYI